MPSAIESFSPPPSFALQVDAHRINPEVRQKHIWDDFQRCLASQQPVSGRVLNECSGGYAVGVSGYVALLPSNLSSEASRQNVGVLQEFHVEKVDKDSGTLVLRDLSLGAKLAEPDKTDLYSNI